VFVARYCRHEMLAPKAMQRIWTAARNEEVHFAYRVALDFDATDNPLYGQQESRFFHGYYDTYICYLPLYMFCTQQLRCAYVGPHDWR
jgi:hypothetical protein